MANYSSANALVGAIVVLLVVLGISWGMFVEGSLRASLSSLSSSTIFGQEAATRSETSSDGSPPSYRSDYYSWNEKGCQEWPKPTPILSEDGSAVVDPTVLPRSPPTGMVVTLARRRGTAGQQKGALDLLCQKIPTQQAYFFEPQGMDLLLLLDMDNGFDAERSLMSSVVQCLELVDLNVTQTWNNLDGSVLTTYKHASKTGRGTIYVAPYKMPYPKYIQQNESLLAEPMESCEADHDYIQGTRYYSDPFLHLKILENYEYMIKMDLDMEFKAPIPFNMMWDMKQQGALFGHAGEFVDPFPPCSKGIHRVMNSFATEHANKTTSASWTKHWKGPCSAGVREFDQGYDQYYTNLVLMNRALFQSEPIRAYGRWMNEYNPGYFKYRWGDQLFFHIAMGMFLGPDFRKYVTDYTDFRCRRYTNCWYFWKSRETKNTTSFCQAPGGVFLHGKQRNAFGKFSGVFPNITSPMKDTPYVNKYKHDCKNLPANE
mmetsp:Transcript_113193/g.169284  ORF Transcript_113193/g.169284 Transcript_113193/m.169284 type:complete len:487 (-) Transcript_113193:15-1475(-)